MGNEARWQAHYAPGVPKTVPFRPMVVTELLDQAVKSHPERTATIFQGARTTFAQMGQQVDALATALRHSGLDRGDRVAIIMPNLPQTVASVFAVMQAGFIGVMINPLYTADEMTKLLTKTGARAVITLDLLADRVAGLRGKTKVENIYWCRIGEALPPLKKLLFPLVAKKRNLMAPVKTPGLIRLGPILKGRGDGTRVALTPDDVALLQPTGGTTGTVKTAMLTHRNLCSQAQHCEAWFAGFNRGEEVLLTALPMFHVFGLTTCLFFGISMAWTLVLVAKPHPPQLLEAIIKFKPTFAPMVPAMYLGLLALPNLKPENLRSIKACFSGSAPLSVETIHRFEEMSGATILEGYGMTELSPVTHINPLVGTRKPGSIGLPLPDTEVRVMGLALPRTEVKTGEAGEMWVRGPQVMKGYYEDPEETAHALTDGWMHTGDIVRMDEDGFFWVEDRLKDMINVGGLKVFSREVEEAANTHPAIIESAAVAQPDVRLGETVKLYVVARQDMPLTINELLSYLRERLARHKVPAAVYVVAELPRTKIGKVMKNLLRAQGPTPAA